MVCHAIAVYVSEQLTCLPYQFNEQVYIVFIVYMHVFLFILLLLPVFYFIYFNALTLNILYGFYVFMSCCFILVCWKIAQMS